MSFVHVKKAKKSLSVSKNWEDGIVEVMVEPCDAAEDPLGFKAIFCLNEEKARLEKQKNFVIGASFLARRENNLKKAGYMAPMTQKAIALIESKIGQSLPIVLA